jgi:hypothetical protein
MLSGYSLLSYATVFSQIYYLYINSGDLNTLLGDRVDSEDLTADLFLLTDTLQHTVPTH